MQSNMGWRSKTGVYEREKYIILTILLTCNCTEKIENEKFQLIY